MCHCTTMDWYFWYLSCNPHRAAWCIKITCGIPASNRADNTQWYAQKAINTQQQQDCTKRQCRRAFVTPCNGIGNHEHKHNRAWKQRCRQQCIPHPFCPFHLSVQACTNKSTNGTCYCVHYNTSSTQGPTCCCCQYVCVGLVSNK